MGHVHETRTDDYRGSRGIARVSLLGGDEMKQIRLNTEKRYADSQNRDYLQFIDNFIDEINTCALRKYNDFGVNL
jgi:hypothetical protein